MASAGLRKEQKCSKCLNLCRDTTNLRCGHNLCRVCIDQIMKAPKWFGEYSCPVCRAKFQEYPPLQRNMSTEPHQKEGSGIFCTYCIHSSVPAVKSCLLCEASLCDDHLRVHSDGPEHILCEPSTSLAKRKCPVHKELLRYYCTKDAALICVSCSLAGEHRGHKVELLDETSKKKKKKLRNVLKKLIIKRTKTEKRAHSLVDSKRKAQEKASGTANKVMELFIDIRRQLVNLEKKILNDVSRQGEQMSVSLSDVIQKLEIKKDELSRKVKHIEELCNMTDPLTFLMDPDTGDLCDLEEGGGDEVIEGLGETHDVDVDRITGMLHTGFSEIMAYLQTISLGKQNKKRPRSPSAQSLPGHSRASSVSGAKYRGNDVTSVRTEAAGWRVMDAGDGGIYGQGPADILLDRNTAANNILISDDLKTATCTHIIQNYPQTTQRFQGYQVISSRGFLSGRHYWDVEISGLGRFNLIYNISGRWRVGMCYSSIDKRGDRPYIGDNKKSWCLYGKLHNKCSAKHDSKEIQLPQLVSSNRFRICLDYEAGKLSFYELCDPIRHLHTFTATFTEPLHAALYLCDGSIKIKGRQRWSK